MQELNLLLKLSLMLFLCERQIIAAPQNRDGDRKIHSPKYDLDLHAPETGGGVDTGKRDLSSQLPVEPVTATDEDDPVTGNATDGKEQTGTTSATTDYNGDDRNTTHPMDNRTEETISQHETVTEDVSSINGDVEIIDPNSDGFFFNSTADSSSSTAQGNHSSIDGKSGNETTPLIEPVRRAKIDLLDWLLWVLIGLQALLMLLAVCAAVSWALRRNRKVVWYPQRPATNRQLSHFPNLLRGTVDEGRRDGPTPDRLGVAVQPIGRKRIFSIAPATTTANNTMKLPSRADV